MRILVVEDDGDKLRRILQVIGRVGGIRDGMVDDVRDIANARRALRDKEYSFLILDIAVPRRSNEYPAPYAGVEFLEELGARDGVYNMPEHIVGLTAHEDLSGIAGRRISEELWVVIQYDANSAEWEQRLQRRVEHIQQTKSRSRGPSTEGVSTAELIAGGETDSVEFKETLRWNVQAARDDERMGQMALKTVAAFLNTHGGTLLVGVSNDGHLTGLKPDHFADADKATLFLTQLIKSRISHSHMRFVKICVETVDCKEIMRVDCERAEMPAYVRIPSGGRRSFSA